MFKLIKIENGRQNVPEPEYLDVKDNEAVEIGEALVLSSGKLTKCAATVKPEFISMGKVAAADSKRTVAVCRIESNHLYDVPVSAAPTALKVGDKVTIHTDGEQVTATTTDGVAKIVALNGANAIGDKITVRF